VPDARLIGDVAGATAHLLGLTSANGKVGMIGYCSGGRQSFLAACSLPLDADDKYPSPEHVAELEEELKAQGKTYEFHSYEGAGHAFFSVNRTAYRPEAAMDGWEKIWTWFGRYLAA
jgi:carboxymethylenebutenolidase